MGLTLQKLSLSPQALLESSSRSSLSLKAWLRGVHGSDARKKLSLLSQALLEILKAQISPLFHFKLQIHPRPRFKAQSVLDKPSSSWFSLAPSVH